MDFYLSFPDERGAKKTAGLLEDAAWIVETSFRADDGKWLVKATTEVSAADLRSVEHGLRGIAADFGGEYNRSEIGTFD